MIFPSYIFLLVFLPVVLALWYGLRSLRARVLSLTIASFVFYGWWDYRFCSLMLASTALDYICGGKIDASDDEGTRKRWFALALVGNLGSLGFFKYYDFFTLSLVSALSEIGVQASLPVLHVVLPVGISFYTFQSLSYSIDIYRRRCEPTSSFLVFAAYVSMYPQLVAGPIVRYTDVEDQLRALPTQQVDFGQLADGAWYFLIGLVKKIWIADLVAGFADKVFDGPSAPPLFAAWLGALAYTFQLYFDFSAYSDMAVGLGKMLGIEFPKNFDSPYKSEDISEFWRRWHITLSSWLRDYLFIPLGGSRGGIAKTLRNLFITMFLGGLWHGAAWTFVAWGCLHGALLAGHAVWKRASPWRLPKVPAVAVTFLFVVAGWVLFRATSFERAFEVLAGMVGLNGKDPLTYVHSSGLRLPAVLIGTKLSSLAMVGVAGVIAFLAPNSHQLPRPRHPVVGALLGLVLLVTLMQFMKATPFLYFQF